MDLDSDSHDCIATIFIFPHGPLDRVIKQPQTKKPVGYKKTSFLTQFLIYFDII